MASLITSYLRVFRLIFVMFSLFLMGDAFYRWDGFSYYASFSEFLPAVALVSVLWTIVAVFAALLIWLPAMAVEICCRRTGCRVGMEHGLLFVLFFVMSGTAVWFGKRLVWPDVKTTFLLKSALFICIAFASLSAAWLCRGRARQWMDTVQERITPLVWLFGIFIVLSVPLVTYHAWIKKPDNVTSQKILPSSAADRGSRPNIILLTFDALTARDMSVYGYERPVTPFINKWAKTASLFTRLYADSNFTSPTTATLMTGKRVWTHQRYHTKGSRPVKADIQNLPLMLKNNGYYNMAFVVNSNASVGGLGIAGGFEIVPSPSELRTPVSLVEIVSNFMEGSFGDKIRLDDWIVKNDFIFGKLLSAVSRDFSTTSVAPEKAFNRFLSVMDNNPPRPFFAWIHVLPPHFPYLPPAPYMGMFDSSSQLRTYKSQWRLYTYQYYPQEMQPDFDIMRARYDEFIRYCDRAFEHFIEQLKARNILKDTVIILSSDHGESFEHNYMGHGGPFLYEQVTHIPLIIREPAQERGRVINDLAEQVDIAPTILELAGIPVPSWMEGRSLVPLMRGERLPSRPVFSMFFEKNRSRRHQITRGSIAVWEGEYKLIHYLEEDKSLLFNLRKDPDELNNLFDAEPETGRRLLAIIRDNLREANERISRGE
ncbi:MAG: sulfatase-like hydrolase/transferase [Deferribacteres bacterium]|nr:sulfatase-like hydrolase/transferase [Deferribacteres bacterium]